MSRPIDIKALAAKWIDENSMPEERWYFIPGTRYYVSAKGRAVARYEKQQRDGSPVYELKIRSDEYGRKYFNTQANYVYTRIYIDEVLANGVLAEVSPERRRQWSGQTMTTEGQKLTPRAKIESRAKALALWLLEDETHPDFKHYYKMMYEALEWGGG